MRQAARRWLSVALAALVATLPLRGASADEGVPPKLALLVMLKVLTYDRNFSARGSGDFVVLVAHEPADPAARDVVLSAAAQLRETSIQSRPLRFIAAPAANAGELKAAAQREGASAIVAAPGLSPGAAGWVAQIARERQVYSMALDSELAEKQLALGVVNKDGRPQIVINLNAAKDVNAVFEPAVLKLARVIQ